MKKRYMAIFLSLCMLIGVLTGCSGQSSNISSTTAQIAATATSTPGEGMSDIPGMTAPGKLPIVTQPVTLTIGLAKNALVMDYEDNWTTKQVLNETGINVDFYFFPSNSSEATQKFEMMVSANQTLPDILYLSFNDAVRANYGKNGVIKPLDDYFKKYAYWYNKAELSDVERKNLEVFGTSPDGKRYAFPTFVGSTIDTPVHHSFINMQWLEKLGLKMPTTTDELYTVLKAFKEKDPNGNKKADEIPLISSSGTSGYVERLLINSFIHYNYITPFNVDKGKLSVPVITEEYREALRYIRKLVKEELLSPLSFTLKGDGLKAMLSTPKEKETIIGMFGGTMTTLFTSDNEKMYEYDAVLSIKGPKGVSWSPDKSTDFYRYNTHISKDCKNPEVAFRLFDYFTQPKRSLSNRYGEPGVDFMFRADDKVAFDKAFPYKRNASYEPIHGRFANLESPWSTQNKTMWNIPFCSMTTAKQSDATGYQSPFPTYYGEAKEKGLGPVLHRTYALYKSAEDKIAHIPPETVLKLIYTEEEQAAINEISASISTYILESQALFCTGGLDIENDWGNYVKNLKNMGLDLYLKTAQTTYDRMYKK